MYKLEFTLKQHTPLIHFQHDQDGATLRASEVKPKLDRFLIGKLQLTEIVHRAGKDVEVPKTEYKSWFNSEEHLSLDYKMNIQDSTNTNFYLPLALNPNTNNYPNRCENLKNYIYDRLNISAEILAPSSYFANSDKIKFRQDDVDQIQTKLNDLRFALKSVYPIKTTIYCFVQDLLNKIESEIKVFFLLYNFGTRQSKGFGCFTVEQIDGNTVVFNEKELTSCFSSVYKLNTPVHDLIQITKKIAQTYKLIRSGQGQREPGGYKKSLLFLYFVTLANPIRWEKRKLKRAINSNLFIYPKGDGTTSVIKLTFTHAPCYDQTINTNWNDTIPPIPPYTYNYLRALLGLNETFEFLADSIVDGNKPNGSPNNVDFKYIVKVKSNNEIERFQSPITCKYINGNIFFCCNPVTNDILSTTIKPVTFNFDLLYKKKSALQNSPRINDFVSNLHTPSFFDINDFFEFCFVKSVNKIDNFIKIINTP